MQRTMMLLPLCGGMSRVEASHFLAELLSLPTHPPSTLDWILWKRSHKLEGRGEEEKEDEEMLKNKKREFEEVAWGKVEEGISRLTHPTPPPLSRSQLIIEIHLHEEIPFQVASHAVQICMQKKRMEFTSAVFQQALDHLSLLPTPPLLAFRTVVLCANVMKDIRKFIVKEVMPRFLQVDKRLWEVNSKGWEGVLMVCKALAGHRHAPPMLLSVLSLPSEVLTSIFENKRVKEIGEHVLRYYSENSTSIDVQEVVDSEKRLLLENITLSKK